ncbi:MAG: DUF5367 family protein [Bacteroidota bacterium]
MNISRAIFAGTITWFLVLSAFVVLSFIPGVVESLTLQGVIVGLMVIPFGSLGAAFYYKKSKRQIVWPVALAMALTALVLDALITVPFIEMPYNGRGHVAFFSDPLFWALFTEIIVVVWLYWAIRVKPLAVQAG